MCFLPGGQHSSPERGYPIIWEVKCNLSNLLLTTAKCILRNPHRHHEAVFIHPTTSALVSSSSSRRCLFPSPPPPALFLSALSQPMRVHTRVLALLRKGVMFRDGRNWFPISSTATPSFPRDSGNLAHGAGLLLGAVDQRDGCLHLRRPADVRQGARAVFALLLF